MAEPYRNSLEHLKDELALLDLLLHREVVRSRPPQARQGAELFRGVFVSDEEVEGLLGGGAGDDAAEAGARGAALDEAAAALAAEVAARRRASLEAGTHLTLAHLSHLFALSPFEERVVVACLALELDLKYEKLFAFLQDDLTRKRPSVGLLLRLFCATDAERLRARGLFAPHATLSRARLLRGVEQPDAPALARLLALDERVVIHLLEAGGLDAETARLCKVVAPGEGKSHAPRSPELLAHL
ncbi:MAG TPA: hypothetical protein VF611_10465, partial [Pyrinomonadaceae bacterium]